MILKERGIRILPDVLLTGGGSFVSYCEWLKNLDHIRPGRMTRRWEMYSKTKLLRVIEKGTGLRINLDKYKTEVAPLLEGPSERDLVESGLEEAMI